MRSDDKRADEERSSLRHVLKRCDTLHTVSQLVDRFVSIARELHGHHIDDWIAQAWASGIPPLRGFADGLLKDYDAVRDGVTLPWRSGAVEGNVSRIKALKRQAYGRAPSSSSGD